MDYTYFIIFNLIIYYYLYIFNIYNNQKSKLLTWLKKKFYLLTHLKFKKKIAFKLNRFIGLADRLPDA